MIVDLHKYLIFGNRHEMDRFFYLAQRAGFLEFIGLSHKRALGLPETAKTLLAAIKIAKHHPIHPQEAPPVPPDPEKLAKVILSLNANHEKLLEEERLIAAEIARIAVFGDFSRSELDLLERESKRVMQFYVMKSNIARDMTLPSEVIYIGTEYDLDYFLAINDERKQYPKMIEILIERPVGELRARLLYIREEIAKLESDLRTYANTLPSLTKGLIECLNEHHLNLAKHAAGLSLNSTLFAIEAWVPETKLKALYALLGNLNVDCEEIAIESRDQIPTYMENTGLAKIGEDIVQVYDIPDHTDKDPSRWILFFFSLFFAMIISDAGYGLIFLAVGLFVKWKFPRLEGAGKRFLKLIFILSTCCIVWGVATSSYFGIEIGPENPLRKTSIIYYLSLCKADYHLAVKDDVYDNYAKQYPAVASARDGHDFLDKASKAMSGSENKVVYEALDTFNDNVFMDFAFLVGILHLSLSFFRNLTRNWAGLGWVVFMIGGYLFFPSIVNATTLVNFMGWIPKSIAHAIGLPLIIAGMAFAFIIAIFKKKWGAFHELLRVVQVFADVLSYLRLYALALGGMVMAHTFNDHLGIDLGVIGSIFIVASGHIINIGLCIMGGIIHGLRLNFLEWYHYCFIGGGRLFNPLRLRRAK
jgi:V/A-type H+-transporting ATPase subunit I